MSTKQHYDEDFKRTLVELYHNGKTQASLIKEYGVSQTALSRWVKQYSTVETDDGEVLTAKQVKELQKRMAQLEEENQILKKAIAIFTPPVCQAHDKKIYNFFCSFSGSFIAAHSCFKWVFTVILPFRIP